MVHAVFFEVDFKEPVPVIVQIAVEFFQLSFGNDIEPVCRRPQKMAIMRDKQKRAFILGKCLGQGFAHVEVEMVGRFVQEQQVRTFPDNQGERKPRFFATGKGSDRLVAISPWKLKLPRKLRNSCSRVSGAIFIRCQRGDSSFRSIST